MKSKLKLSELNVQSFVTSSEKNENTADLLGGSVPTDTDNPLVCVNYTAVGACLNSDLPICFNPVTLDISCVNTQVVTICKLNTRDPQKCIMSVEFGCYDTLLC